MVVLTLNVSMHGTQTCQSDNTSIDLFSLSTLCQVNYRPKKSVGWLQVGPSVNLHAPGNVASKLQDLQS